MEFWVLISEAEASGEQGSLCAKKKKTLSASQDGSLTNPAVWAQRSQDALRGEEEWWRRGGGEGKGPRIHEKKKKKKKKKSQFSLPTGQCQFRDNILALIALSPPAADYGRAPPCTLKIETVSSSRSLLASRSFWPSIQDSSVTILRKKHPQTARKPSSPPSPFHLLIS